MFLSQHEEDRFHELKDPQAQEQPRAYFDLESVLNVQELKPLAFKEVMESESQLVAPRDINRTDDHLKHVVKSNEWGDIERLALRHELRPSDENKP